MPALKVTEQYVAIKKLGGLIAPSPARRAAGIEPLVDTLGRELASLGYVMSRELRDLLLKVSRRDFISFYREVIDTLSSIAGADLTWKPMYRNFPDEVMTAHDGELFFNALMHYWTAGEWLPSYPIKNKPWAAERTTFIVLRAAHREELQGVFDEIMAATSSVTPEDVAIAEWLFREHEGLTLPAEVPFKENAARLSALLMEYKMPFGEYVRSDTDVLRVAVAASGGDVTLSENTPFSSLPRRNRRQLLELLELRLRESDFDLTDAKRHRGKWVRLFHSLHAGERRDLKLVAKMAAAVRSRDNIVTDATRLEAHIESKRWRDAIAVAAKRPGDLARRFDKLASGDWERSLLALEKTIDGVSTNVLVSLLGHFKQRLSKHRKRVSFTKTSSVPMVITDMRPMDQDVALAGTEVVEEALRRRFSKLPPLGRYWVDPVLYKVPVPSQARTASTGKLSLPRGARVPIDGGTDTLRFFVHWVGQDIDLSLTLHDDKYRQVGHVSYTNLRFEGKLGAGGYSVVHSGDIVRAPAPDGACEFIDMNLTKAPARYAVMNLRVYSGPPFKNHSCSAGWMLRGAPGSNEVFDPKTVHHKFNVTVDGMAAIPAVVDIAAREVVWCDMATTSGIRYGGNNVESNSAGIADALWAAATMVERRLTIGELIDLHATRGTRVHAMSDADVVFDVQSAQPAAVASALMP